MTNKNEEMGPRSGVYAPDMESRTAVVEVKKRLSSARGLRDALAQWAGFLTNHPDRQAILLLVDSRLTPSRIFVEWDRLRAALRPEIAERLHVVSFRAGKLDEKKPPGINLDDWKLLEDRVAKEKRPTTPLPKPDLKSEVLRVMVHQWILGRGPMTSHWMQETVGCNYRTVASTLERLGPVVERHSDRRVQLKYFPSKAWAHLLAGSDAARATLRYVDRSDQARSPESLLRRLRKLGQPNIAAGGVLGARHYYPDLDLVGTPRLDLSIHCPGKHIPLDFVPRLDPALEMTRNAYAPSRLTLHFVRRRKSMFDREDENTVWADPVECLLDLCEMRLEPQAGAFTKFLSAKREPSRERG